MPVPVPAPMALLLAAINPQARNVEPRSPEPYPVEQAGRGANSAFYAFGSPGGEPAASSEGPGGIPGGIPITQAVNGLHRPWRRRHSASEAVGSWST